MARPPEGRQAAKELGGADPRLDGHDQLLLLETRLRRVGGGEAAVEQHPEPPREVPDRHGRVMLSIELCEDLQTQILLATNGQLNKTYRLRDAPHRSDVIASLPISPRRDEDLSSLIPVDQDVDVGSALTQCRDRQLGVVAFEEGDGETTVSDHLHAILGLAELYRFTVKLLIVHLIEDEFTNHRLYLSRSSADQGASDERHEVEVRRVSSNVVAIGLQSLEMTVVLALKLTEQELTSSLRVISFRGKLVIEHGVDHAEDFAGALTLLCPLDKRGEVKARSASVEVLVRRVSEQSQKAGVLVETEELGDERSSAFASLTASVADGVLVKAAAANSDQERTLVLESSGILAVDGADARIDVLDVSIGNAREQMLAKPDEQPYRHQLVEVGADMSQNRPILQCPILLAGRNRTKEYTPK